MKLRSQLTLGFAGILSLLLLLSFLGVSQMNKLNATMDHIIEERYKKIDYASTVLLEQARISRRLRELVLLASSDKALSTEHINAIEDSHAHILSRLENLEKLSSGQELDYVVELSLTYDDYREYQKRVTELVGENRFEEGKTIILVESRPKLTRLNELIEGLNSLEVRKMDEALQESKKDILNSNLLFISFVLIGIVLGIGITLFFIKKITRDFSQLNASMKKVALHEDKTLLPRLKITSRDEFGEIAETFNEMASALEHHARDERDSQQAMAAQNWIKASVAEITAAFQGIQEIQGFAQLVIRQACKSTGASYGVFYARDFEKGQDKITRLASFAGEISQLPFKEILPGEGLVGQCLIEKTPLQISDLPEGYIQIFSGLGAAPPRHLYLFPIEFEGVILGVLELASLTAFNPQKLEFLKQSTWHLGVAMNRIFDYMKVQKLLTESQALTEELQTQSEELQIQQEELRTFNDKLEDQYKHSEQKTQELLKTQTELEEKTHRLILSSQYKSEFLSNMSHELRTPLNSLLILTQMLAENKTGNLTNKQVEYAATILTSGQDLLNLINDILDLAKIESGKTELQFAPLALTELKSTLERQFSPLAEKKHLSFGIELAGNLPETLVTDSQRLKQILQNLLSNAIKFTHQGYVQLRLQTQLEDSKSYLAFAVSDSGIGIPLDKQELIFEEFQQADGTTTRKYGGTGLGLSICKELAALFGGWIELESQEGIGSTFTLILPLEQANQDLPSLPPSQSVLPNPIDADTSTAPLRDLEGQFILVVDDDMRNIFAITAALEDLKFNVLFAENGKEALERIHAHPEISLILMDIMLPEMDGYEAIQQIRRIPAYAEKPIIALTAKAMKGDREKCLEAGASDYITKPLDIQRLISLIRVWLYR